MRTFCMYVSLGCAVFALSGLLLYADEATAKAKLSAKGLRVTHAGLSLTEEVEFSKGFSEVAALKRKLGTAVKEFEAVEEQEEQNQELLHGLMQKNKEINSELAAVPASNVFLHNRLVAENNVNAGEINELIRGQEKSKNEVAAVRKNANSAREEFVQRILQMRTVADRISAKYTKLAGDDKVKLALEEWNSAANTHFEVEPSRAFRAALKRLEALEKLVISEKIPLRREGNSFLASVVIDGKYAHEMIVDSGASILTLPNRIAVECGINVGPSDPQITLVIANGQKIKGRLAKLDSVRVGKFTVQNVQCVVLGSDAPNVKPLLGMTFLGRFNFELNTQTSELALTRINTEGTSAAKPKKARSHKPAKKTAAPTAPVESTE